MESNIDRLLKARAEIEEALRQHKTQLTVLFTDVVGSTAYFERFGDTSGLAMMHRHAELATAVVEEFRGRVIKTIGDSVMAQFPEPALAVRAGVEIQRRLLRMNQKLPERDRLELRVGINEGEAYSSGPDVFGDAVNVAARIAKQTGPAQILISRSVREAIALETDLRCAWQGKAAFKGKAEPEDIFEVIWTDTGTYHDLRAAVTQALARGELVAPGLEAERMAALTDAGQPTLDAVPQPEPAQAPAPTAIAARYELLEELGRGGMGIVYKARDRETGETVALKVIRPEIAADPVIMERFKNELRLARKITHRNVCRTHEFNRAADGTAYISMEFVEGDSLRAILKRFGGLGFRKATEIALEICAGLREAHREGVVHRDLKPENVMLTRAGEVKVMDFGIARSVETGATLTGTITGTPAYMAPEQAEGKSVDQRADLYALGLILYELYTGEQAVRGETPVAVVMKQIHETPASPRELEPALPAHIERAILRCLTKDPAKRFQSVAELEATLTERPAPAVAPEGEPVPSPHLSRWQGLDTALLVLGIVGMIYFLAVRDRVLPLSHMRLKVDAIGSRRAVEDLAGRLGRPVPENLQAETKLEFRGYWYAGAVLSWLLPARFDNKRRQPLGSVAPDKPLVAWQMKFDWGGFNPDTVKRSAVVDNRGKVERLQMSGWIPSNYQPRPVEERRAIARQAAELACGTQPQEFALKETVGGEQGASYTAEWKPRTPPGSPAEAEVSLLAEKVVDIQCRPREQEQIIPSLAGLLWFTGTLTSIVLVVLFVLGGCYRLSGLWKRLPLAVVLGAVGLWMLSESLFTNTLALLMGGVAATGVALIGLATAEYFLRRREPERVASYVLVWRGRFAEPAVGLAILRGALVGLSLAAFETLLAHANVVAAAPLNRRVWLGLLRMFSFVCVDPEPVGQALESFSPPLFAAGAALLNGVVIALIFLGLSRALLWDWLSRGTYRRRLGWLSFLWLFSGLHLHLAEFLTVPAPGKALAFFLEALLLVWLLERYDVLTMIAAVGTAVLWMLNYPLLLIFREVGNTGHWVVFLAWGAVVLAAAALGFRSALGRARQRLVAQFQ